MNGQIIRDCCKGFQFAKFSVFQMFPRTREEGDEDRRREWIEQTLDEFTV